jgi:hypothetical protein
MHECTRVSISVDSVEVFRMPDWAEVPGRNKRSKVKCMTELV